MNTFPSGSGQSGDLFEGMYQPRRDPMMRNQTPPELTVARALCRQIRRKHTPQDKKRIAHMICLNLLTLLRHGSKGQ